ncbi:hypothetical protein [Tichowtungia aerotolerans]|uniref:Uncharacterized protein n=1 Tax=Tichowtungia aerotolerans TaxID=2697043 RepID=A0A6P1ME14_9BACT|nr:hypothetical protein [Tichowtungia aerotolerans]QHI69836.1 hypothetical protein GT409_10365 [Tichowtungia aerotolerans]
MRSRVKWMGMLMVVIAVVSGVQAATVDMVGNGTDTNGFHYWSDTNNWNAVITSADSPRVRYDTEDRDKLYLDASPTVNSFTVLADIQARIKGTGTLTMSAYLNLAYANAGVDLMDSVTLVINNRIRLTTGTTALNLYNDSVLDTKGISFDVAGSKLLVTLNDNSSYIQTNIQLTANMHADSQFVLNDSSSVVMETMNAAELYDNWFTNGATFYLNDTASITMQTSGNNIDDIATYNAAGHLVINGSTNAVLNVDYTYDTETGVLQAGSASGFVTWAAGWGVDIGSETNDYDGDLLDNLAEYALGGNPTNALHQGEAFTVSIDGGTLIYEYPQRTGDPALSYYLETTDNLVSGVWTNDGYSVTGTNVTGNAFDFVTNNIPVDNLKTFIKLVVEKN